MEFSYFDQFTNIEIDLTSYLTNLSSSGNTYTFNNIQPVKTTVTNLFTKYDVVFDYKDNLEVIIRYDVKDDELVETVSYNVYGTVDLWWIVLVFNNIKEPWKEWPLSQSELIAKVTNMYETEAKYSYQTYYDYLTKINDERKQIILPKPDTVKEIIWKYRQAILNG